MGYRVSSEEIALFLNEKHFGNKIMLNKVVPLNRVEESVFTFCKNNTMDINEKCLVLVPRDFIVNDNITFSFIKVSNPRLSFAKVVNNFFVDKIDYTIEESVKIGFNCNINKNVKIGYNCIIGNGVSIGTNTIINNNVLIYDNTEIGNDCYIKSNTVIGEDGFGFDFEEDGTPIRIPHLGNVKIGNNVEIGAKNTIARATLGTTTISDNVKIDDQVHIAHNSTVGKNTIIAACAEISGSVNIGQNCWIGPNSSIIQKVKIGNNVTIGIGTIVTKDIEVKKKIMALEGLPLRELINIRKRIQYGK